MKRNCVRIVCTSVIMGLSCFALRTGVFAQNAAPSGFGPSPEAQAAAKAQTEAATAQSHAYLNEIGFRFLAERTRTVATIETQEQALARQASVRRRIIELVGGIPATSGPINVKNFDRFQEDLFSVENIALESAPHYWMTANVYIPRGAGPFPALIVVPGHGPGKAFQYSWCANFAAAGFLVLSIDPMGQGERMEHWDDELGRSKLENSGDHEHANQTALLIGQHIARYWLADGIRAVDYLVSRSDVASDRIGVFGCSGGGMSAAYMAAFEPRIRVAATSSYITSFQELLPGNGPQDAEQTIPGFIAEGFDFADWIELAAPRPYAVFAFEKDFFPIGGTRATIDEAKRFYGLFGKQDQLLFIEGSGGHCNLTPVWDRLMNFLTEHLRPGESTAPTFQQFRVKNFQKLTVTPTGQTTTSLGSLTVEALTRIDAKNITVSPRPIHDFDSLAKLQKMLREEMRRLAAIPADLPEILKVTTKNLKETREYRLDSIQIESAEGITLGGVIGIPTGKNNLPVVLWLDAAPVETTAQNPEFLRLVQTGHLVVAFHPRDVLGEPQSGPEQLALGQYMPELLRAIVVRKTIVGMRAEDLLRTLNWIDTLPEVDAKNISLYAKGGLCMAALHVAALDERVAKLYLENGLLSYRTALHAGLHKNLSEVVVPSVLTRYDTPEMMQAIFPRPICLINPTNAMGQPMRERIVEETLDSVAETDRALDRPGRVRLIQRGFADPLPIE